MIEFKIPRKKYMVNTKFMVILFSHKKLFYLFSIFGIGKGERNVLENDKKKNKKLSIITILGAKIRGVHGYCWVRFESTIEFILTFDILQIINMIHSIFLNLSKLYILGYTKFFIDITCSMD